MRCSWCLLLGVLARQEPVPCLPPCPGAPLSAPSASWGPDVLLCSCLGGRAPSFLPRSPVPPLCLLGLGVFPGVCRGLVLLGPPPPPVAVRAFVAGTAQHNRRYQKVDAFIFCSPAPVSSPMDDLEPKASALALGEGSRDKIISASS